MISITNKQAQLKQLERLESIKDDIDKLGINIFKLRDLWPLVYLGFFLLIFVAYSNEWLISLELLEEFWDKTVDNGDDINNFFHDFILHKDVALCFNDFNIQVVVLFRIINNRIFGL